VPFPGFESDLMGNEQTGYAQERDIEQIIKNYQ
jgi:hypothetical protein